MSRNRVNPNYAELLIPAGGPEAFLAAVENGADAIYLGGRAFNARMNAGNFDDETMQQVLDYAHLRGVKVFVTMNTLLRDEELPEALSYAGFLYRAGVDALIIQDLGLGAMLREEFPDLPLHLSTQATACDLEAVRMAKVLGYERVVLARELSLPEIRDVCREGILDIEVFIHGALCICYSGQCQMSRYYGGRSGNRGSCAQPCRLPYRRIAGRECWEHGSAGEPRDRRDIGSGSGKSGEVPYPLSPRDLCLADHLPELLDAGVHSLKVEGRMKSPEYVAVVTRIYRRLLDCAIAGVPASATREEREALLQIFNRGQFTEGYLYGNPGKKLISGVIPKNQGIPVGHVTSVQKGSALINVKLHEPLSIGDGVEIHARKKNAEKPAGNILSYVKELPTGEHRIGDLRGAIHAGDAVYRTSSKAQILEARRSFEGRSLSASGQKAGRQRQVDLRLSQEGGMLKLTAGTALLAGDEFWASQQVQSAALSAGPFERDPLHAAPRERFESALRKTGSTPFAVRSIVYDGPFDLRVRMSELNALRRDVLAALEDCCRFRREAPEIGLGSAKAPGSWPSKVSARPGEEAWTEVLFYTMENYRNSGVTAPAEPCVSGQRQLEKTRVLLPLAELCLEAEEQGVPLADCARQYARSGKIGFYLSLVTKGLEDEILLRHEEEIYALASEYPVYAGNLGWFRRLSGAGVPFIADAGLNVYNERAARLLKDLGASGVRWSLEAAEAENGPYPLMVSEHAFEGEAYAGPRGQKMLVRRPRYSSQTLLLPKLDAGAVFRRVAPCI